MTAPVQSVQEAAATVRDEFLSRHAVLHSGLFDDCQLHSCVKNRAALALLISLAEQTETLRHHHVPQQSTPGDPVGHDGFECPPNCDACSFARELRESRKQTETLRQALDWYDFIEDVEADGPPDEPRTVSVTRTNAGWQKTKALYVAALAASVTATETA